MAAEIAKLLKDIPECDLHLCTSPVEADSVLRKIRPDILFFNHDFVRSGTELLEVALKQTGTGYVIVCAPQNREREYSARGTGKVTIQTDLQPEAIIATIKPILMKLMDDRKVVVSGLSSIFRDFVNQEDDLLSMLAAFEVDQEVLHYRIVRPLGEGGMAEVYLAEDLKEHRMVALKVLPLASTKDQQARRRFDREARLALSVDHPNIIRVFAIHETGGLPFLVMEYIQGETLRDIIAKGPLPLERLFRLGSEIAHGLAAAHAVGLIHRDLKPANIMVLSDQKAKILDFGLAKRIQLLSGTENDIGKTITRLTTFGVPIGTTNYMSPEQTRGEHLDFRTDIFSLGTVLYEAATGKQPFKGNTIFSIMNEIVNINPEPPSSIRTDLPQRYDEILRKAIAKDRTHRYSSAAELANDLHALNL